MNRYFAIIITIILVNSSTAFAWSKIDSRGPFRIRNQFPLGLQFLSFPAEDAFTESQGQLIVSLQYDHSNTFAMSPGAISGLKDPDNRMSYIPNNYYIDSGTGRFNLNLQYGLLKGFTIGIDLPLLFYHGGFLDASIELFHNTFGIDNYSRSRLKINNSQLYISSEQHSFFNNTGYGIGDIVISIKTYLFRSDNRTFNVSLQSALKLPTGNSAKLMGSGSPDYGFNVLTTNIIGKNLITNNFSVVLPGQWRLFPDAKIKDTYVWMIAYERLINLRWSFILQRRIHTSPLSSVEYPSAAKPSFEWSAGAKIDISKNYHFSLGITQNYINHENVPDFGIHLGIEKQF